jgi:hypothetical protein
MGRVDDGDGFVAAAAAAVTLRRRTRGAQPERDRNEANRSK